MVFWPIVHTANILCVFPAPSVSHQKTLMNLAKALSERGHKVTAVTTQPFKDSKLKNLKEIDISFLFGAREVKGFKEVIYNSYTIVDTMIGMRMVYLRMNELIMERKEMENLVKGTDTFDVVIVEPHDPLYFAFGTRFNAPVIGK